MSPRLHAPALVFTIVATIATAAVAERMHCQGIPPGSNRTLPPPPGPHVFTAPLGVTELPALAIGGGGSGNHGAGGPGGGSGAGAKSVLPPTSGQQITVVVGRGGGNTDIVLLTGAGSVPSGGVGFSRSPVLLGRDC